MFERFTERARRIIVVAQEQARLLEHNYIGTEHILLAMAWEDDTIANDALTAFTSFKEILAGVEEALKDVPSSGIATGSPPFTPRSRKVLECALREALQFGHSYIGPEHVLLGFIRENANQDDDGLGMAVLKKLGVKPAELRQVVVSLIGQHVPPPAPKKLTLVLTPDERDEMIRWIEDFGRLFGESGTLLPEPLASLLSKLRSQP